MISAGEVNNHQHIYVISGGVRHVKIGIASNVAKRMQGIQTGCPFKIKLAGSWRTPHARLVEIAAHSLLAKYHASGEWFDVPAQTAVLVVKATIDRHPRIKTTRVWENRAVVFCGYCRHTGMIKLIPEAKVRLRCSKCTRNNHVHIIKLDHQTYF